MNFKPLMLAAVTAASFALPAMAQSTSTAPDERTATPSMSGQSDRQQPMSQQGSTSKTGNAASDGSGSGGGSK